MIKLIEPQSGRTSEVTISQSRPTGMGRDEKMLHTAEVSRHYKNLFQRIFRGQPRHQISFFERKSKTENIRDSLYAKWLLFKKVGLPVVPTLRFTDRGTLMSTDVTADGTQIYGKSTFWSFKDNQKLSNTDTYFKDNFPQFEADITTEAERLAIIASESGIALPADDPFELLIKPNHQWQLMILDLELAIVFDQPVSQAIHDELVQSNRNRVDYFLKHLEALYSKLNGIPFDLNQISGDAY